MRVSTGCRAKFDTGDDEKRMSIFRDHKSFYLGYEDEIREWLGKVWDKLHAEKPAWFTEDVLRTIPEEFIPHATDRSVREEIGWEAVERLQSDRRPMRELSFHMLGRAMGVPMASGGEDDNKDDKSNTHTLPPFSSRRGHVLPSSED